MYTDRLKGQYYTNYLNVLSIRENVNLQLERLEELNKKLVPLLDDEFEKITLNREDLLNKINLTELKVQYIKNMLDNYEDRFQILIDERFINITNNIESIIENIENLFEFNVFNMNRPIDIDSSNFNEKEKDMLKYNSVNPIGIRWFGGKLSNKEFLTTFNSMYAHIIKIDNSKYDHITNYIGSNLIVELFIFHPTYGFTWVVYSKDGNHGSNFYIKYKSENDTEFNLISFNDIFDKYENIETDNIFSLNMLFQLNNDVNTNGDIYVKVKTNLPSMSENGTQNILLGLYNGQNSPDITETDMLHNIKLGVDEQMLEDDPNVYAISLSSNRTPLILNNTKSILLEKDLIKRRKYTGDTYRLHYNPVSETREIIYDTFTKSGSNDIIMKKQSVNSLLNNNYQPIYYKYSNMSDTIELDTSFFKTYYSRNNTFTDFTESTFGAEFYSYVNKLKDIDLTYYNTIKDIPIYKENDFANYMNGEKIIDMSNFNNLDIHSYFSVNNPIITVNNSIETKNKIVSPFNYSKPLLSDDYKPYETIDNNIDLKSEEREYYYKSYISPISSPIIKDQNVLSNEYITSAKILYNGSYMRRSNYEVKNNKAFTKFNFNMFNSRDSKIIDTFKSFTLHSKKYNKFFICSPTDTTNNFLYILNYNKTEYYTPYLYPKLKNNKSDDVSLYYGHPELNLEFESYTRYLNYRTYNIIEADDGEIYLIMSYILTGKSYNDNRAENSYFDTIIYKYVNDDVIGYFEEIFMIANDRIAPGTETVDPIIYNSFYHNGDIYINIYGGNNDNYTTTKMYCITNIENEPTLINLNEEIRTQLTDTYLDSVLLSVSKTNKGVYISTSINSILLLNMSPTKVISFSEIVNINGNKNIVELNNQAFIYTYQSNISDIYTIEQTTNTLIQKPIILPEGTSSTNVSRSKLFSFKDNIYLMIKMNTVSITNTYNNGNRQGYTHLFIYDNKQFNFVGEINNETMDIIDIVETSYGAVCLGYFYEIKNNFGIQLIDLNTLEISTIYSNTEQNPANFTDVNNINPTFSVNETPDKRLLKISCEMNNQNTTNDGTIISIPMSLTITNTIDTELNKIVKTKFTERF